MGALALACRPEFVTDFGTTELVLTTNLPMPRVGNRIRVDIFEEDASLPLGLRWTSTKELAVRSSDEVPLSFSILTNSKSATRALVRIRVYAASFVRDYLGERYHDGDPSIIEAAEPNAAPRLIVNEIDASPNSEPLPDIAIDRLVWVKPTYGEQKKVRLFLEAQCSGTMANLKNRGACTRIHGKREPASDAVDEQASASAENDCTLTPRAASSQDGQPLYDEEICVPGGIYLMGTTDVASLTLRRDDLGSFSSYGARVAQIAPLIIDRYEVTVARWRAALRDGLRVDERPDLNDAPFVNTVPAKLESFCTLSTEPITGPGDREDFPLNCVSAETATAFCKLTGRELPTEAQWEWVATSAGLTTDERGKRLHPWGFEPPECSAIIYGRAPLDPGAPKPTTTAGNCYKEVQLFGPSSVRQTETDVFPSVGVYGLGGNVSEFMKDAYHEWRDTCWATAAWQDPQCATTGSHAARGGSWTSNQSKTLAVTRLGARTTNPVSVGFRCARRGR